MMKRVDDMTQTELVLYYMNKYRITEKEACQMILEDEGAYNPEIDNVPYIPPVIENSIGRKNRESGTKFETEKKQQKSVSTQDALARILARKKK